MEVWLADLTYDQQSLASDVVPAAIGGLAEIIEANTKYKCKLFKQPQDLLNEISNSKPFILGLSNYIWNANLALTIAKLVKKKYPELVIVTGGPNISTEDKELQEYFIRNPFIDFAVLKEGESGVCNLLKLLEENSIDQIKSNELEINGVAYLSQNEVLIKGKLERFLNLEEIPSPYLSGKLDKWLDGKWLPVIQTNRGCPFTCTFCTEGQTYWSKVRKKPLQVLESELKYIADKLVKNLKYRSDLLIADSNFGMYEQDLEVAKVIAKIQSLYNYPTYINVATGKNKKEKVLEVANIVQGAMKLAGSVQSLDEKVLLNIKRDNISSDSLMGMALEAAKIGTNTYSEVILGLPGDTVNAHLTTLQKLIDAGFTTIAAYQMMLLPATEMNLQETREKYGFITRFRLLPRCYGRYNFEGRPFNVAEIEEIVISHNTLSIQDYLYCRRFNLITTIFYNDGVFLEFHRLLSQFKISSYNWLLKILEKTEFGEFNDFMNDFEQDTLSELWSSRDELAQMTLRDNFIDDAINGKIGNNILFHYKAKSLTTFIDLTFRIAEEAFSELILESQSNKLSRIHNLKFFVKDLFAFRKAQIHRSLIAQKTSALNLVYFETLSSIELFMKSLEVNNEIDFKLFEKFELYSKNFELHLSNKQIIEMQSYNSVFGKDEQALARILSRIFLRHFFRSGEETKENGRSNAIPSAQFGLREV